MRGVTRRMAMRLIRSGIIPRRTLMAAMPIAALTMLALVDPVSAECSPQPVPFPQMRYAFTATVREFSHRVPEELPESYFDWHLELDVNKTYRGDLPHRLEANGWDVGCDFTGVEVRAGERVFIAAEDIDVGDPRLVTGSMLIWRDVGGGRWAFYADALQDGARTYPIAAVRADTTAEIIAVLAGRRPPDTASAPPRHEAGRSGALPVLAAVFAIAFTVVIARHRFEPRMRGKSFGP
jgi:hypothetical protein